MMDYHKLSTYTVSALMVFTAGYSVGLGDFKSTYLSLLCAYYAAMHAKGLPDA